MSIIAEMTRCCLLHEGGEASIYKVWAENRPYALKLYREGLDFDAGVVESISQKRLEGVINIRESGLRDGRYFIVYDFIDGLNSRSCTPLGLPEALFSMRLLVAALKRLAQLGVYHGDLNPSNVLLTVDGPVLIDCGIKGPGTLAYAAPERMTGGKPDEKSDLFSLGLLLYFWLTGEDLLKADNFEGFLEASSSIKAQNVTMLLFGKFGIAASLENIWKGTLCADPDNRLEDLDELDELLEIAFDECCGGSVVWAKIHESHIFRLKEKIGTDCLDEGPECDFPFRFNENAPKKKKLKALIAAVLLLILLGVILLTVISSGGSSVDETGDRILRESRSLEGSAGDTSVTIDSIEYK